MNARDLHNARLEAVGPAVAAFAFEAAAKALDGALQEGKPAEEAVQISERVGNRVLDDAIRPHGNEPMLVWRKESGELLPTAEHRKVSRIVRQLSPAHQHALGVQVHRQAVAYNSGLLDEHDPTTCGCSYIGIGMWDCGHTDQH